VAEQPDRLNDQIAGGRHVVFLSVGEPSGDLHGAALARALRARIPGVRLIGLGGPLMSREGVELLASVDDLAVMGFVEVVSRLPFFLRLRKRVFATLASERVDLVIPVDYPGFNLRLARHARSEGRRVLYYIAPQVWAWHASRAGDLARDTDRVAVILPFEESFLREHGASADFVGHPLLDEAIEAGERGAWFAARGLDLDRPLLALMPGSRQQELRRHLAVFVEAAGMVQHRRPDLQVIIGAPAGLADDLYAGATYPVTRDSRALLAHASAALVKSGTTTLETALAETPFVVAYRVNPLSYQIARRVVRVPHIALANLVANRRVVPEFVQHEATPEALSAALLPLLDSGGPEREAMLEGLRGVRQALGKGGAAARVADMAADLLGVP
jgi:lipid-A-disaccharide synthase